MKRLTLVAVAGVFLVPVVTSAMFVLAGSTVYAGVDPAAQCVSAKEKATGVKALSLLRAFALDVKKPNADKLAADISKAQSKFTRDFNRAEDRAGCDTNGDAGTIEAKVDALVYEVIRELCPACGDVILAGGETCDPVTGCELIPDTVPCYDGLFCNGADTCAGGSCNIHAGNPCSGIECNTCQEDADTCIDPPGAACSDTDGNVCTIAGCSGMGRCDQEYFFESIGTPCPDDGDPCTADECDGAGVCDHFPNTCGNGIRQPECGEDCDGSDAGCVFDEQCHLSTCTCDFGPPCGDDQVDPGEDCDGAEDSACPGMCQVDCTCAPCDCCADSPELLSFETGIATGVGGVLENFRCSGGDPDFVDNACKPGHGGPDCDFGPCYIGPNFCSGDFAIACTSDAQCQGTCGEVTAGNLPLDLERGRLYTGGGLNSVPLPLPMPDKARFFTRVTSCESQPLGIELGPTAPTEVGKHQCTLGRTCDDNNTHCVLATDCTGIGDGSCNDNCIFGAPLPIPNKETPETSTCNVLTVGQDVTGTATCSGNIDLDMPIVLSIYLNGDLLTSSNLPDLPGVQSCPLCVRICSGGTKDGLPCRPDNPNRGCAAGQRVGKLCTSNSDCPNPPNPDATCAPARTEYSDCINGGGSCPSTSECLGGQNDGDPCTPGTSTSDLLGDAQDSYPTSHDCVNNPLASITDNIGGLPISFSFTSRRARSYAVDHPNGARVFCGFCRDVTGGGSLCFEGSLAGGCPASIPQATGNAVPCNSDADCADADTYESCVQRDPGAFSETGATMITVWGSSDGECVTDGQPHATSLVSLFCHPPTFGATVDAAGDLPGPGAMLLQGVVQLSP